MAGKPHFEVYREGMKAGGQRSLSNAFLAGSPTDGQWRWRLVGGNGEPMAHGESYPDKDSMLRTITLIANLGGAEILEVNG
ncbi:YegP family protein [Lysobacter sp. Hz 25]|uniref:YegP family protein n=1 Tax=Lysobacter sp. Hz 25 TaxID=3383698 RepID=UPI0038D3D869